MFRVAWFSWMQHVTRNTFQGGFKIPQVLLNLPEETYRRLKKQAQLTHLSIQEFLRRQIIRNLSLSINTSPDLPWGEQISGNGTILVGFSKPVDVASLAGITITVGAVTATAIHDNMIAEIQLKNVAAGEQTLDISTVTDTAGNPVTGDTEFTFEIKE